MDIHKEWELLNEKLFSNQELKNEQIMNAITSESSSSIHKLKKGLKVKSYWCLLFIALFSLIMFISRDNIESVIAIGIVNLMYIIGFFVIGMESRKMDDAIADERNILDSMKRNAKLLKRAIKFEMNFFVFGTPVIALCAMCYGEFRRGSTFEMLINDTKFLIYAIVICTIAVPAVYFGGAFLTKKSFGPHIAELNENISKLEGVEFLKNLKSNNS